MHMYWKQWVGVFSGAWGGGGGGGSEELQHSFSDSLQHTPSLAGPFYHLLPRAVLCFPEEEFSPSRINVAESCCPGVWWA